MNLKYSQHFPKDENACQQLIYELSLLFCQLVSLFAQNRFANSVIFVLFLYFVIGVITMHVSPVNHSASFMTNIHVGI